jgi:hypothetical protein
VVLLLLLVVLQLHLLLQLLLLVLLVQVGSAPHPTKTVETAHRRDLLADLGDLRCVQPSFGCTEASDFPP